MWYYGVFGKQRDERLWERHLYICEEANRQVPPMFGRHLRGYGMYVGWHSCREVELTMQCLFLW
jgi:hypothetical protein